VDPNKNDQTSTTSHVVVPSLPDNQDSSATQAPVVQTPPVSPFVAQESPISSAQQQAVHQSAFAEMNSPLPHQLPPNEKPGRKINTKLAIGALIVLALVALPTTIYLTQQQQTVQQQAAPTDDKIVAVYNGENITRADVQALAEEWYPTNEIDSQALQDALDVLLERKILDKEKTDKNINISQEEIQAKIDSDSLSFKEAEYAVLKDLVTQQEVKNWQVYTIGFWQPSTSDLAELTEEEKAERIQILSTGKSMINEAKTRLENDESAFSIAKSLLSKNPNFRGVLAVNGYQIQLDSEGSPEFEDPKTYTHQTKGIGQPFYDTIYSLKQAGEVKLNNPPDGSGADAIKLVSTNDSAFNTYENWLADKKKTAVINGL